MSDAKRQANKRQANKRQAWRFGLRAEALCAWVLRLNGYLIEGRRVRTPVGEIDIVARRATVLAIIEVKGRADLSLAAQSIGPRQRARIMRAAEAYLRSRPRLAGLDLRFDVMLVRPWRWPVHLVDAWRPGD